MPAGARAQGEHVPVRLDILTRDKNDKVSVEFPRDRLSLILLLNPQKSLVRA